MKKKRKSRKPRRRRSQSRRTGFIELQHELGEPAVANVVEAYNRRSTASIEWLWELGEVVADILAQPQEPGERSADEFIRIASQKLDAKPPGLLFTAAKFYQAWPDPNELEYVLRMQGEFAYRLNVSHLMLIGQVRDPDGRRALASRAIENLWGKRELINWLTDHYGRDILADWEDIRSW